MQTYTVLDEDEQGHLCVNQDLGPRGIQPMILEYGELKCESCDAVFASVGSVLSVGEACWRCGTRIHSFTLG